MDFGVFVIVVDFFVIKPSVLDSFGWFFILANFVPLFGLCITQMILLVLGFTTFIKLKQKKNGPVSLEAIKVAQKRPMGKKVGIRVWNKILNIYFFHYSSLLLLAKTKISNFCYKLSVFWQNTSYVHTNMIYGGFINNSLQTTFHDIFFIF